MKYQILYCSPHVSSSFQFLLSILFYRYQLWCFLFNFSTTE